MKKRVVIFTLIMTLMFSVTVSNAIPNYSAIKTQGQQLYIVGPNPEPYQKYSDSNGDYYMRVRESKLIHGPADNDPVVKYKPFGLVYRTSDFKGTLGSSVSITDSVSTTTSNSTTVSSSLGIADGIFKSSVSVSHTQSISKSVGKSITKTYSSGYTYGFPISTAPSNCTKAEIGIGFQYATYRTIIDVKKQVRVDKVLDILSKRYVNECSLCKKGNPPGHIHDGPVGYYFNLSDGTTVFVPEGLINGFISRGVIDQNMTKYYKTTHEWKYGAVIGEVKLPIEAIMTTYYDAYGNILR